MPRGAGGGALTGGSLAFSFTGLVIASVIYSLPFAVQPFQAALRGVPHELLDAGAALGARPWRVWRRLHLPLAWRGIAAGLTLGFAHTLGEFGVVLMIGGSIPGVTRVASIALYDEVQTLDYAQAHAFAAVLLGLSFALLLVVTLLRRRKPRLDDHAIIPQIVSVRSPNIVHPFRFQKKDGHSSIAGRAVGTAAVLLVALLVWLSADPEAHERFHHDAGAEDHHCVITDFATGEGFYLAPQIDLRPAAASRSNSSTLRRGKSSGSPFTTSCCRSADRRLTARPSDSASRRHARRMPRSREEARTHRPRGGIYTPRHFVPPLSRGDATRRPRAHPL